MRISKTHQRAPLVGKIFLSDGTRLTPTHSRGASGRTYRYYAPLNHQQGLAPAKARLSAHKLEAHVRALLAPLSVGEDDPLSLIDRIVVGDAHLDLVLPAKTWSTLRVIAQPEHTIEKGDRSVCWSVPYSWSSKAPSIQTFAAASRRDPVLIRALRVAHAMLEHDHKGRPVLLNVPRPRYDRRIARLAFLSPTLQRAIVEGRQPFNLTLEKIVRGELPLDWDAQMAWACASR